MIDVKISSKPLVIQPCIDWAMSPECGALDIFIGTVRSATDGKVVTRLEFEAYEAMAVSEMTKIAERALAKWPIKHILIHHRTGALEIGAVPVIIVVSAPRRDAAFEACRFAVDTLKQTVPIWKKELFEDGDTWVNAHP